MSPSSKRVLGSSFPQLAHFIITNSIISKANYSAQYYTIISNIAVNQKEKEDCIFVQSSFFTSHKPKSLYTMTDECKTTDKIRGQPGRNFSSNNSFFKHSNIHQFKSTFFHYKRSPAELLLNLKKCTSLENKISTYGKPLCALELMNRR